MDRTWEPVEVFAPSQLAWEVTDASVQDGDAALLKLAFRGTYRPGSQGSPDARFMKAITGAALANAFTDVVLFDFMHLDYRWGDTLMGLFHLVTGYDSEFPIGCVVAAGPNALPAISSLAGGQEDGWLFPDVQAAFERSVELALERSRTIG